MADGSRRSIEQLAAGDRLLGWNEHGPVTTTVVANAKRPSQPGIRLETAYGNLVVTADTTMPIGAKHDTAGSVVRGSAVTVGLGHIAAASMTFPEAWALGVMVGDAYLGDHPKITQTDTAVVDRLNEVLPHSLSIPWGPKQRDYSISSRYKPWLREHQLLGKRSADKIVPDAVVTGGAEAWRGFLSGWLDTDGSIRLAPRGNVTWFTISPQLASEAQSLLLKLGIMATRIQVKSKYNGQDYRAFHVKVASGFGCSEVQRLLEPVGVKRTRLAALPTFRNAAAAPRGHWPPYGMTPVRWLADESDVDMWQLTVEGGQIIANNIVVGTGAASPSTIPTAQQPPADPAFETEDAHAVGSLELDARNDSDVS